MITPRHFIAESNRFLDKCRSRARDRRMRQPIAQQVQAAVIDEWINAARDGVKDQREMKRVLLQRVRERLSGESVLRGRACGDRKAGSLWLSLALWAASLLIKWLIKKWWDKHGFNYDKDEPTEDQIMSIVKSEEFWGGRIGKAVKSFAISAIAALLVVLAQWLEALPTEWADAGKWWALPVATLIPWCVNMVKLFGTKIKEWGGTLAILAAFGLTATWLWR